MTRVVTETLIARPRVEVFEYVTTPANWLQWQRGVRSVGGPGADHSALLGEEITAAYSVWGRLSQVVFKVVEREEPRRWMIEGVTGRARGTIAYEMWPHEGATKFARILDYRSEAFVIRLIDKLIASRVERESHLAVRHLAEVLTSIPR